MGNSLVIQRHRRVLSSFMSFFALIAGLALLAVLLWGAVKFLLFLFHILPTLNVNIAATIIAGSLTIITSVSVLIISKYLEANAQRRAAHRDKKVELYDSFMERLFRVFVGSTAGDAIAAGIDPPFLIEMHRKILLWSGPEVIKAYAEWHKELTTHGISPRARATLQMVDFFLALRKDLGHSNKSVKREYLLRFLLKNPELLIQMYKANPTVTLSEVGEEEERLKVGQS